jgi:anti-anti-sigma factor
MNLPTEIFGDVIVVHTPEELGSDQANDLEQLLVTLERRNVVADLDSTETIDSRGLTAIVVSQDNLRELGGDLKLATTIASNRKILEMTRLDRRFEVFESVIDAVRSFQ